MRAAERKQTALMIQPRPTVEIDPVEAEYVVVKNANVRAEPTVRSAKVATLNAGASVHVAGKVKSGKWYLVERDEKPLGYVYSELLKDAKTVRQDEEARRNEGQARRQDPVEARKQAASGRQEEESKRAEAAQREEAERERAEASRGGARASGGIETARTGTQARQNCDCKISEQV